MATKKENIARVGLSAIGFVYILVGVLTALKTFNLGGREVGTKGVIGFLSGQPVAKVLLAAVAIGLFSYTFWRFYQTFTDSRNLGTKLNALFVRAGFFTGGLFYGSLGFIALKLLFGAGYDTQQESVIKLLNSSFGSISAVIIGLIFGSKALFEIYFILSNQFKKNVQSSKIKPEIQKLLLNLGIIGHSARGIIFGIMSFLTIRTGLTFRNEKMSKLTDAFQFIDQNFGAFVLSIVAVGMSCYGLFMLVKARYLYINMK
ncbi:MULTISPECIES: DUF1206 domain-containing protein [Bizionia]|uniref:DUF1206 domain-containing protein n=1 Tax=Bizionia algoritergicola TaxID=291187 RepID=A0A5D0QSY9_9FLAO|nr:MULTISPECIES: DUF1206 domain-containing protein [Bizionia]OBX21600.1 hypothetical protein BAA08_11925 [Bizionia sp. APA-3]TYB72045.1 DUF1206 domain-containing protein [Bizionia algoritergicola]